MTLQSDLKLPWPEIIIQYTRAELSPKPAQEMVPVLTSLEEDWTALRSVFQGKYNRFASYLLYLSTDFSGGFKVCPFLDTIERGNPFSFPIASAGLPLPVEVRNRLWQTLRSGGLDSVNRGDWELIGISFLFTGDISEFKHWVEKTKLEFGVSDDCKRFLTILGWEQGATPEDNSLFQTLVNYSKGLFEQTDFGSISNSILKEGNWQLSGVLIDAIEKTVWVGPETLVFFEFLSGFYSDWKDWEKAKFLNISLGKIPPFYALRKAKKILNKSDFADYQRQLKLVFRGDWEEEEQKNGYEIILPLDPFLVTLIRYDKEKENYLKLIENQLKRAPHSHYLNLQMALLAYRDGNFNFFLKLYEKGGRLRFLPIPLYLFARVKESRKEDQLSESILEALTRLNKIPVFPPEFGEI